MTFHLAEIVVRFGYKLVFLSKSVFTVLTSIGEHD